MSEANPNREIDHSPECPEFVYINLPLKFAPIVLTAPNKFTNLYQDPVAEASELEDVVVVKMRNNGQWRVKPIASNREILDKIIYFNVLERDTLEVFETSGIINSSRGMFLVALNAFDPQKDTENSTVKAVIQICTRGEGEMSVNDFNAQMEIEEVCYKGQCVSFDKINEIWPQIEEDLSIFDTLMQASELKEGDYLYRAPDQGEWRSILKDGILIVRDRTNFEKEIGPQVSDYAKAEGYAGKIIRIKVAGPYFKKAGMAVPRIESTVAHFAEVEILINEDGDEWISVEEYKKRTEQ